MKEDPYPESFVSKEEYYNMYIEGKLHGHKINKAIIKEVEEKLEPQPQIKDSSPKRKNSLDSLTEIKHEEHFENDDFGLNYGIEEKTQLNPIVNTLLTKKPIISGDYAKFENSPMKVKRSLETE